MHVQMKGGEPWILAACEHLNLIFLSENLPMSNQSPTKQHRLQTNYMSTNELSTQRDRTECFLEYKR
jgi:hypothetical protein